jgi:hypothetical protein
MLARGPAVSRFVDLTTLLKIGRQGGWFQERTSEVPGFLVDLEHGLRWVQWLRNLVHPGAFVRELPDGMESNETTCAHAYSVFDTAYGVVAEILAEALKLVVAAPQER